MFKALCQSSTIILILSSNIYKVNNYLSQSSSLLCSINFLQPWWYVYFEILLGFRIKSSFILITHVCCGIARGHRWHDRGEPFSHAEWPKAFWTWERSPRWSARYCIYSGRKRSLLPSLRFFAALVRDELKQKFRGNKDLKNAKCPENKRALHGIFFWLTNSRLGLSDNMLQEKFWEQNKQGQGFYQLPC